MNNQKKVKRQIARAVLWLLIFFLPAAATIAAENYMHQLENIDKIRSSDPELFAIELQNIKAYENNFNHDEAFYFQYLVGYETAFRGEIQQAILIYEKILASDANNEQKARARMSLINEYAITRNWLEGLRQLQIALKELGTLKNIEVHSMIVAAAAYFYNEIGQYTLSLDYSEQLKKSAIDDRQRCIASYISLDAKTKLKIATLDNNEFIDAANFCFAQNENVIASAIIATQSRWLLDSNQPKTCISLIVAQLPNLIKTGYKPTLSTFYATLAEAYWSLGEKHLAFINAQKVIKLLSSDAPINESKTRAYKVLYEYYRSHGDDTAALDAYINYAEADKANLDEIKTKTMAYQLVQHQNIEQQSRITLLNQQNRVLTLQQKLAKNESRTQRDLIVALICVIALLILSAAQSWRNQRHFRKLAEYDGLTNIFSRGHFTVKAHQLLQHSQQHQEAVSCVMFDIDHFKQINDSKGHKTGDWALRNVAQSSRQLCRHNDLLGRVGGEEFCILLPQTNIKQAQEMAELLRQRLCDLYTSDSGYDFSLTASFGVSDTSASGYKLEGLMHDADQAMYQAKSSGRNRVCCFVVNECNSLEKKAPLTPSQPNQL